MKTTRIQLTMLGNTQCTYSSVRLVNEANDPGTTNLILLLLRSLEKRKQND